MTELLDRARALVAAGPYDARTSEIAAVHAALYPKRDAVCQTCPAELGRAYYAIKRWAAQQEAASTAPSLSSFMKKNAPARFKSDTTIYTPHGLGVAYSNANLTDSAARAILKADPDAADLFEVLPAEADEEPTTTTAPASAPQADSTATGLSEADLDKLADKVAERLRAGMKATPTPSAQPTQHLGIDGQPVAPGVDPVTKPLAVGGTTPVLSVTKEVEALPTGSVAVTTGQVNDQGTGNDNADSDNADSDNDGEGGQEGEKPVRLSRMNKEQLLAAYRAEVQAEGGLLVVDAHNDDLREAIAKAREAKA